MSDYDVVVVGASIAGCTAATFLGRSGARVALVESHADPQTFKRLCTHFIQPSASPTIERLGLDGFIEQAGGTRNDLNIWTRYGWICAAVADAPAPMCDYPAWNIRREVFDPQLRELAANTEGVELMLGHTVTALSREGGSPAGRVSGVLARERNGEERELTAKLVVAADGRDSHVAKLSAVAAKLRKMRRFGYYAYYRDTPLLTGSSSQLWMLNPDMAYAFPTDGDLTLLACMPHEDRLSEFKAEPEQAMVRLFEGLVDGPRVDPRKREGKVMGRVAMPNTTRPVDHPGLVFVGDAAIAADPLWGVGCGWALQSGEWLADALAGSLGSEADVDRGVKAYGERHRKGLAAHEKLCSAYSTGHRFNPLEKLLYRAAARDRQLADRMALMGGRWITPQEMMTPATIGRIVRVNLSRASSPLGLRRAPATPAVA